MAHLVKGFNILYDEFIDKLLNILPNTTKIKSYNNLRIILQKANNRGPMNAYMKSVHPFSKQIFNEDTNYFLNNDRFMNKDIVVENFISGSGLIEYWESLDDQSKSAIWLYLQSLLKIGYKVYNIEWNEDIINIPFFDIINDKKSIC
jgi:hypothetical protein